MCIEHLYVPSAIKVQNLKKWLHLVDWIHRPYSTMVTKFVLRFQTLVRIQFNVRLSGAEGGPKL